MRPRKNDRHLPACMYHKHGNYWLVKQNRWHKLGSDYEEALKAYAVRLHAQDPSAGGMPLLIDRVLEVHLKQGLAKNTERNYRRCAERLKRILAEFEPHQVRPKHIAAIKTKMADTPGEFNILLVFSRIVFNYALEGDLVENNPCASIRRYKDKPRNRYLTHQEFNALLGHCEPRMRCLFQIAYLTGQRISDVLRIRLGDISEEGIAFTQQKTGAKLLVGMTADMAQILRRVEPNAQGWLFYAPKSDSPLSYNAAREAFARACASAGIEDASPHDLRAKSLTDADAEGKDAQKLGGHSDQRMTKRYLRGRKPKKAQAPELPPSQHEY